MFNAFHEVEGKKSNIEMTVKKPVRTTKTINKKGIMRIRNVSKTVAAAGLLALASSNAKADLYNLIEPHANFGEPAGFVYGTVDVEQGMNAQTLAITVTLSSGVTFVGSGAGFALGFDLVNHPSNISFGPLPSNFTGVVNPINNLHADGTGDWDYAVDYTNPGGSGTPPSSLSFTVTKGSGTLSPTDIVMNTKGLLFISDISAKGVTGDVAVVPEPTTMIAGALLLLPFGASTVRILRKNRIG
jgi:hypothetical protein